MAFPSNSQKIQLKIKQKYIYSLYLASICNSKVYEFYITKKIKKIPIQQTK